MNLLGNGYDAADEKSMAKSGNNNENSVRMENAAADGGREVRGAVKMKENETKREVRLLNNDWKFTYGFRRADEIADWEQWPDIGLPHSFGIPYFMEHEFYVGYGCYRKELQLSSEDLRKRLLLDFHGVFQCAEVFLNGVLAGEHKGGYTSFAIDLTGKGKEGSNELFVRVNNEWDARLAPRAGEHQFNGGIYRDVSLILTDPVCVDWMGTFVWTKKLEDGRAWLEAQASVHVPEEEEQKTGVLRLVNRILLDGRTVDEKEYVLEGRRSQTVSMEFLVNSPNLWSPENPARYQMTSELYDGAEKKDVFHTDFGIRTMRFDKDTGFYLNGKPYKIWGANVHQDHAGWADAVTRAGITRDIRRIKDCGMNFIRGSHYPHHPFFAEECDRLGILFWSELCFWGTGGLKQEGYWTSSAYPVREEDQEPFEESCKKALEEMIRINRNHPSVIIWSVCNEPFFSEEAVLPKARELVKKLVGLAHELDPSRKAAVGGAQRGGFDVLGDVAGYNGDGASLYPDPGFPNFVSEYGSQASFRPGTFSPNFQDGVTEDDPAWRSGKALWCAFHHGSILGNMGAMGMIDYYRLPLNTWYWYRKKLLGIPEPEPSVKGEPERLELSADRKEFLANGQEDVWLCVTAQDRQGRRVDCEREITLEVVEGDGIFPTGKRIMFSPKTHSFLDGRAAIEFRSYYGGTNLIEARSEGLEPVRIGITALGEERTRTLVPMERPPYLVSAPVSEEYYDLAKDRPVFADSARAGHEPNQVTDTGSGCWIPEQEENAWICLDLEGEKEISGVEAVFVENPGTDTVTVWTSPDGISYEPMVLTWKEPLYQRMEKKKIRFVKLWWKKEMQGVRFLRVWALR